MRTKRIKIYTFEELSIEAQKTAIEKEQESSYEFIELNMFAADAKEQLSTVGFNNAELRYSLSYCQGDGLSFDADIDLEYFLDLFAPNLTPYRRAVLLNYIHTSCEANTGHYSFAHKNQVEVILDAYNRDFYNVSEFVADLQDYIQGCYMDECDKLEKQGYAEIEYQQSEECAKENILSNGYEFLADGTQY